MKIEIEFINNGCLVYYDEGLFDNGKVFFKKHGQAVAYIKRRLDRWRKSHE